MCDYWLYSSLLFRYLYCDEIQLEADTVLATLYVAKKYIVPHLARACVNYLETSLTAKNACLLLSQSRLFEEPDLMQRCWEVIDAQVSLSHSLSCLDVASQCVEPQKRHMSFSTCLPSVPWFIRVMLTLTIIIVIITYHDYCYYDDIITSTFHVNVSDKSVRGVLVCLHSSMLLIKQIRTYSENCHIF